MAISHRRIARSLVILVTWFAPMAPSFANESVGRFTSAETDTCSGTTVVVDEHTFSEQPATCMASESLLLGPNVGVPPSGDVALVAPRIEMHGPLHIAAGASFSAHTIASLPGSQAVLGPLSGTKIAAYRLTDLLNPIETTGALETNRRLELAGRFALKLAGIPNDEWILVTASGGVDIDADDSGFIDPAPTVNAGTLHALAKAVDWRAGGLRLNALTDMAWRYTSDWVGDVSAGALQSRLNEVAATLISQDIDGDGRIDADDLLAFDPSDADHRGRLRFTFTDLFLPAGYIEQIRTAGTDEAIESVLGGFFGAYLSFGDPPQQSGEVTVRVAAFGQGRISSNRGGLLIDSEQNADVQQPSIFVPRGGDPLTLTATPTAETQILSWEGCDWISDDQTQCRIDLLSDRQVEIDFGYVNTVLAADFIDLSTATVVWSGDRLDVTVDPLDTDLLTAMDAIAAGTYVAGLADVGPFLRQVVGVTELGGAHWELKTIDATLAEVITQGTGVLQRTLTHGDLAPVPLTRASSLAGPNPVQLLPPDDPDDRVFRLRIAAPANGSQLTQLRTAASTPLECEFEGLGDGEDDGGTLTCTKDEVSLALTGELDVTIDVDAAVAFDSWKLWNGPSYFKLVPEVTSAPRMELEVGGALETPTDDNGDDKWRIELATLHFSNIKFAIGPVPVWIKPEVKVWLGVNGKVEAALAMGVRYTNSMRAGVLYDDGKWQEIKGFNQQFTLEPPPTLSGTAELKAYVDVSPFFYLYSATGPGLGLEAYLKAEGTAALDFSDCPGKLSYGIDGGLAGSFKWDTPAGETKLGKLLNFDKVQFKFEVFDWSKTLYAGELNTCEGYVTPPILSIDGEDIVASQTRGESQWQQTQYVLSNVGERPLPWKIGLQREDAIIAVSPTSGELGAGDQESVTVTINDTASLPLGTYRNLLRFENTYSGALNQSHLGSQERSVVIQVLAPTFPTPSLIAATRIAADAIALRWSYDDPSRLARGFRLLYTQEDPEASLWLGHPDAIAPLRREATLTGLPTTNLYVAVEAFGEDTKVHQSFSTHLFVPGQGEVPEPSGYPLNDTGITACADDSSNGLSCPVAGFPGQDAQFGRDATHNDDRDGHAGFSFTKLDADGNPLPASATVWSCVRDNVTGRVWEVKTNDGGLRDMGWRYAWYNPDNATNGGDPGTQNGGSCQGSVCDTNGYVQAVNAAGLCGARDWRLPSVDELLSIVSNDRVWPTIDTGYFPNTNSGWFWSSSPNAYYSCLAWGVGFSGGGVSDDFKNLAGYVRLVRGGQ